MKKEARKGRLAKDYRLFMRKPKVCMKLPKGKEAKCQLYESVENGKLILSYFA